MIIKQELVARIKDYFDLNIYETKVWLALLAKGIVSAGEVAELSGVPRSRTYDVLESLAKRGFAIIKVGKPIKYIANDPQSVLEKMKMNIFTEAQEKDKTLSNFRITDEYKELDSLYKNGISPVKTEDLSGLYKGRSNILPQIKSLVDKAKKEVSIYTSVSDFEDKLRVLLPALRSLEERNVKSKIVLSGDADKVRKLNNKNGLKAKHSNHQSRMFIADKTEMLFMLNAEKSDEEVAIWLNTPTFSNSISHLCDINIG